ncbi:BatA domain-containing protein [Aeoliella sp.]|uniref:BatA domain-containing protein n=1 Tax=Aeoliella sp. TaxID=2795800 RepID=UPI003CCC1AFB
MSVLAPLYLLGLAAISLPLLFHLIRRTPRGEMLFSSLMFLQPSPPRLTKRSRLENLLLLLLRGLALALLALAFARPLFRQAALVTPEDVGRQRVAVLVDTSASMRRGDLWQQAVKAVDKTLSEYRPQDRFAVYAFDETLRPIASYQDLAGLDPARRRTAVAGILKQTDPTWAGTHLGQAMADALASLEDMRDSDSEDVATPRRIVLISDLQAGCRLDAISGYEWPEDAALEVIPLTLDDPTNAGLQLLGQQTAQTVEDARDQRLRVRVTNTAGSNVENFRLQWQTPAGQSLESPIDVHAPSGESRVVRVPPPKSTVSSVQLVLAGDSFDFDNTIHYLPPAREALHVVCIGSDDPDDTDGMAYYLNRAIQSDASRSAEVVHVAPGAQAVIESEPPQLVVATSPPSDSQAVELRQFVERGGLLLYVVTGEEDAAPLATMLEQSKVEVTNVEPNDYAMLGEIEFDHPLFSAMAGPQFNNFAQILFWKYRRLNEASLPDLNTIARFDSGDPAILQRYIGTGELLVMTAGWSPGDSQLARSWKFPLMLASLIASHHRDSTFRPSYQVNQRVPLPHGIDLPDSPVVTKPGGEEIHLTSDATAVDGFDAPGVYRVATRSGSTEFAVHLDPTESNTAPLPKEVLEQAGIQLSTEFDVAAEQAKMQQMRDVELEGRQKVWKWLVALAIVILITETLLAGWLSRPAEQALAAA